MHVLIIGADGYIGWPLSHYLKANGYRVAGYDSLIKRDWEKQLGACPVGEVQRGHPTIVASTLNRDVLYNLFDNFMPDAVVHLGEQPSAPFSMIDAAHAHTTIEQNIRGTLNVAMACARQQRKHRYSVHLIKLGSMGEYGTPNIPIEEGWLDITHKGHTDRMLFPKKPGSIYHATKVADSTFLEMFCRLWDLAVTDLNQGVVWGHQTEECPWDSAATRTSFHIDEIFGTVINRFCAQRALGLPKSVYGSGQQTRGFLHLNDSLQCIRLALDTPAAPGEFRVFNQFWETLSVRDIADLLSGSIELVSNPRVEADEHFYEPVADALPSLGFIGTTLTSDRLGEIVADLRRCFGKTSMRDRALAQLHAPRIAWRQP